MIRSLLVAAVLAALPALPVAAQETLASASAKYAREFAASDTNKDGVLTRPEMQARIGRMKAGAKPIDPVHAKRLTDLWFDRADTDKNGKVTQNEGQALLAATFVKYDANKDGKVGGGERTTAKRDAGR